MTKNFVAAIREYNALKKRISNPMDDGGGAKRAFVLPIRLLRQAIELLPPLDKAVLVLSAFENLPKRDIGEALGLTVLAVKARLHRARLSPA